MNINNKDISIIVIIFIVFILYLYLNNSIEPFTSNDEKKTLESKYQNIVTNLYQTIKNEIEIIDKNHSLIRSISNIFKNNSYNLKKISQSNNLRVHLNNLIKFNNNNISNYDDLLSALKEHKVESEFFNNLAQLYDNKKSLNLMYVNNNKKIIKILDVMRRHDWENNTMTDEDNSIFDDYDPIQVNREVKQKLQEIETDINKFSQNLSASNLFDSKFRNNLKEIFNHLKELNKNILIREEVFNINYLLNKLFELYQQNNNLTISNRLLNTYNNANERLKINMTKSIDEEIKSIEKLIDNRGNVLSDSVEVNYLNTADVNNNIVYNFCKKIRKLDKPNENNLMFIRFSKEFVEKKNKHIERLQKEIDNIQQELYKQEVNDFNSNKLRIEDQASKQYEAIMKAKENIENSKKFKVTIS